MIILYTLSSHKSRKHPTFAFTTPVRIKVSTIKFTLEGLNSLRSGVLFYLLSLWRLNCRFSAAWLIMAVRFTLFTFIARNCSYIQLLGKICYGKSSFSVDFYLFEFCHQVLIAVYLFRSFESFGIGHRNDLTQQ